MLNELRPDMGGNCQKGFLCQIYAMLPSNFGITPHNSERQIRGLLGNRFAYLVRVYEKRLGGTTNVPPYQLDNRLISASCSFIQVYDLAQDEDDNISKGCFGKSGLGFKWCNPLTHCLSASITTNGIITL